MPVPPNQKSDDAKILRDPVLLCQKLIQFKSVTPIDDGCLVWLKAALDAEGFTTHWLPFYDEAHDEKIENLVAIYGPENAARCFAFAGHTDVVPPGPLENWRHDPFAGVIEDGKLYGRGAVDMKGGNAAFIAAMMKYIDENPDGDLRLMLIMTGDEEARSTHGTVKIMEWLETQKTLPDFCLIGEPCNPKIMGEVVKIGRRGSFNAEIKITGKQGHVAYPDRVDNPIHRMIPVLAVLQEKIQDEGDDYFTPSSLQITSVDVGNTAYNVTPQSVTIRLNVRFNPHFSEEKLLGILQDTLDSFAAGQYKLTHQAGALPFRAKSHPFQEKVIDIIEKNCQRRPEFNTAGGTSDARFIQAYCPVLEFGLVGASMHQIDEHVDLADLQMLANIYYDSIQCFATLKD